ncbi:MAG: Ig-like domain-containing protein, partial [Saprospiraceae bacterium]
MHRTHLIDKGRLKFRQLTGHFFNLNRIKDWLIVVLNQTEPTLFKAKLITSFVVGIMFFGNESLFAQFPAPTFSATAYSFCEGEHLAFTLNNLPDPSGFPGGDVAVQINWYLSTSGAVCGTQDVTDVESVVINSTSHFFITNHILTYPVADNALLMVSTSILDPLNTEGGRAFIDAQTTCVPINVNPRPTGTLTTTNPIDTTICQSDTFKVTFTATIGTGPYDIGINGTIFNNVNSGDSVSLLEGVHFMGDFAKIYLSSITDNGGTASCTTLTTPLDSVTGPRVNEIMIIGNIQANQTICSGTNPVLLTGTGISVGATTYRWEYALNDTGAFFAIAGTDSINHNPGPLTADTWFRRVDIATINGEICEIPVDTIKITVNNIMASNVLSADQVLCAGEVPSSITGISSMADGVLTFGWDIKIGTGAWIPVVGATDSTYTPTNPLIADTWYRRVDTSTLMGVKCIEIIDTVKLFLNDFTTQGTLTSPDQVICPGIPNLITGTVSTGGDRIAYAWESSTDSANWAMISGAIGAAYTPTNSITTDTWYRRIDTVGLMGYNCWEIVDTVKVRVNNFTLNGTIGSDRTICAGVSPGALAGTAAMADGVVSYGWELSTNNGATYTTVAGANGVDYIPSILMQDTWYHRVDTSNLSGVICVDTVGPIKITVNNFSFVGNLTNPDDTICVGDLIGTITGLSSTGDAIITHGWESRVVSKSWSTIVGATSLSYTPPVIYEDTWYRRIDSSTVNDITCIVVVDTVRIAVNNLTNLGALGAGQVACQGFSPTTLTGPASVGDGTISHRWEYGTGVGFSSIAGATNIAYSPGLLLEDSLYRRIDISTWGTSQCEMAIDTVNIIINNVTAAMVLSGDQTICSGTIPDTIMGIPSVADGTLTYGWESRTNGIWNTILGATNSSYIPTSPIIENTWFRRIDTSTVSGVQCIAAVDTVKVSVNSNPNPVIAGTVTEICLNDAIYLPFNLTGGSGIYTDTTWLTSDVTRATVGPDGLITAVNNGFANIRAVITDDNGCTDISNSHTVIILNLPTAGEITGLNQVCMGDSIALTANVSGGNGGNTISWLVTNGTGSATINAGGVLQPTSAGTVNVSYAVTDNKTCSSVSPIFTVTIDTIPTAVIVSNDTTICQGDLVTFTGTGGDTYEFLVNNVSQQGPSAATTFATNTLNNNDQVSLISTNSNGCLDTSGVIIILVDTIPMATLVSDVTSNAIGVGQTVVFTAGGGTSYEFFVNNTSQGTASLTSTFSTNTLSHLDTVMVEVTDGNICSDTAMIIMMVNNRPIAINDTIYLFEDALFEVIDVQANDTDPEGDQLSTVIFTDAVHGVNSIINNDSIQYMPDANFNGLDSIEYWVCDGFNNCAAAKVYITVQSVNDIPMPNPDTLRIMEDASASLINILLNDIDGDGDSLTARILTIPNKGIASIVLDSTVSYTPHPNVNGSDVVTYEVCDTKNACSFGLLIIEIMPKNDAPMANTDTLSILEDMSNVIIPVTINDVDIDEGDSLFVTIIAPPTSGGTSPIIDDTLVIYTPPLNFHGIDTIIYQVCDLANACTTDTVFVRVQSVNEAPIAANDFLTVNEDATNVVVDVQANDTDGDGDTFTTSIISSAMLASTLNGDSVLVTLPMDFTGVQVIVYSICDNLGLCDTANVTLTVLPINDAPVANIDNVVIPQDTTLVGIAPLLNDTDVDDDSLTLTVVINPTTVNGIATLLLGTDSIVYTPPSGFSGLDTIRYTVCDTSNLCTNGMVIVTVGFVNTPPNAVNDALIIAEDSGLSSINVLLNDNDINGLGDTLKVTTITTLLNGGIAAITGDSSISYTPALNFNGVDSLQYTVCDTSMGCSTAWVFFTITPVNDVPVAANDTVFLAKDTMNTQIVVLTNDMDIDGDALTVSTIGTSTQNVSTSVTSNSISYTAPNGFIGVDTITYKITDTGGLMDTALLIIVIRDLNNIPPVANPDFATTVPATSVNIDVQANDIEPNGDDLITSIMSGNKAGKTAIVLKQDSIKYNHAITTAGYDKSWLEV